MDYKSHSFDHRSGADEGTTKRGKARIVDVALKALLNVDTSMKEIKRWENERSLFKSKMYNQAEKIRCLEANNDSLNSEVKYLKSRLVEAEETEKTRKKCDGISEDKKIDKWVVDSAGKVIRTVEDLSNELVSAHETLSVFRNRNECLRIKTDNLRAMIRVSGGNSKEFRKRVDELNSFVLRMDEEICMLKSSLEGMNSDQSLRICEERTKSLELLRKELEIRLMNDRRALLMAGNPFWSVYLKRIAKLENSSQHLLQQLEVTKAELRAKSHDVECPHSAKRPKGFDQLKELVKRVGFDLKSLKTESLKIGSRGDGESCMRYSKGIATLEKLVATSKPIINKLIIETKEAPEEKQAEQHGRAFEGSGRRIKALEVLAKKFKSGIEELKITVASGDSSKLIEKNREFRNLVRRLKSEAAARDEENNSLGLELAGAKIAFREKVEALEKMKMKYEKMANKIKNRGRGVENDDQQRIESLVSELEQTKIEVGDTKRLRDELNGLRQNVANFEVERAMLLEEINKNRTTIEDREKQILKISREKESVEQTLTKDSKETERKLITAVNEIKCLKKEITKLKEDMESTSKRCQAIAIRAKKVELNRLEALLKDTAEKLESTSEECASLKSKCNEAIEEKTKIELEISRVRIQNETLIDDLNSERVTTAKTLSDLQGLKRERSTLEKNLEESERDKDALRTEVDELRQEKVTLAKESLSLKSMVSQLAQNLEELHLKKTEILEQSSKLEEEKCKQRDRLDALIRDNNKLNDELDKTRSDKLDIAGKLNEWKLQCEETKSLLDSRVEQVRSLNEELRRTLQDSESLKMREAAAKLEVARLLEANSELRAAIDVSDSGKTRLEEQVSGLKNECQSLRSQLAVTRNDNEALRLRADKLAEDVKKLRTEMEQLALDRVTLDVEHRDRAERQRKKLDDFEIEHVTLKAELVRLRAENSSLKTESQGMSVENEKMQNSGADKGELSGLAMENKDLKFDVASLRNANAKTNGKSELAKIERDRLCQELQALRTENCTLRMLLEKIKSLYETSFQDSRKLEERLNEMKLENDELRKCLEDARNDIASRDDRANGLKAEKAVLEGSYEEKEERHRVSKTEVEEMRSRNEDRVKELSNLKKDDFALNEEVNALRSMIKKFSDDNSKLRTEFAHVEEELEALKVELARSRAENSSRRTQLDANRTKSSRLESENLALKELLEKVRHSKILDAEDDQHLRGEYEELKIHKVALEGQLMDARKEISEYAVATLKLNGLKDKLEGLLKDYAATKKLRLANEEIDHSHRPGDSCVRSHKRKGNIEGT